MLDIWSDDEFVPDMVDIISGDADAEIDKLKELLRLTQEANSNLHAALSELLSMSSDRGALEALLYKHRVEVEYLVYAEEG